jgi:hypothetical protein
MEMVEDNAEGFRGVREKELPRVTVRVDGNLHDSPYRLLLWTLTSIFLTLRNAVITLSFAFFVIPLFHMHASTHTLVALGLGGGLSKVFDMCRIYLSLSNYYTESERIRRIFGMAKATT